MRQRGRIVLLVVLPVVLMILPALVLVQRGTSPPYDPVAWAASSGGNAILDPGEECDPPGSITCPPGSPAGAILPCNADCACAQAPAPLDHFQCYALKPRHFDPVTATVVDQFGTLVERVRAPNRLCAPADKDGGGIGDPTDHLTAYELKPSGDPRFEKRPDQTVVNQFGSHELDVLRPSWLLVPSSKDGVAQTPPLDHFQCYVIKRSKGAPKFAPRTVTVSSQIETVTLEVVRPFRLCAPADKNGEDPRAPSHADHLLCYRTRSDHFGEAEHTIENQFGSQAYQLSQRREFCVPSTSVPATHCPELLVNGSFDLPVVSNTSDSNGWTSANIDTAGGWKPTDGNPGPHFTVNQAGQLVTDPILLQNVAGLVVGETYRLAGDYRSFAPGNGDPAKPDAFAVMVEPQPLDHPSTVVLALPRPHPADAWTRFAVEFVPTGSDATVSFVAERMGDDSSFDVDNLSLVGPLTAVCR